MGSRYSIRDALPTFSEEDCEGALYAAKWPSGYHCPRCAYRHHYSIIWRGRKRFECSSCGHQTSLTAGTILEGTRTPLSKWFQAMHLMQIGISAKLLSELIEVTYKTAWLMNHKLRFAIEQWDTELPLEGDLKLLGTFYGYEYHRRCSSKEAQTDFEAQPVMIGASIDDADTVTRLKMKCVDIRECRRISAGHGSTAIPAIDLFLLHHTYGSESLGAIQVLGRVKRMERTELHVAWQEAVRWLAWTFGGIGPKHLQAYLNEFCFRRLLRKGALVELIEFCGTTATITYGDLVGRNRGVHRTRWSQNRGKFAKKVAS